MAPPPEMNRSAEVAPYPGDGNQPQAEMPGDFGEAIYKVSDLVDKYWNGSKSLLKSVRFKSTVIILFYIDIIQIISTI